MGFINYKTLITIGLGIVLSGCVALKDAYEAYKVDVPVLAKSYKYVNSNIDGVIINIREAEIYNVSEKILLESRLRDAADMIERMRGMMKPKGNSEYVIAVTDVDAVLLESREIYYDVYEVVSVHFAEYPPETQQKMLMLDDKLKAMDTAWRNITTREDGSDATPVIKSVLGLIGSMAKAIEYGGEVLNK